MYEDRQPSGTGIQISCTSQEARLKMADYLEEIFEDDGGAGDIYDLNEDEDEFDNFEFDDYLEEEDLIDYDGDLLDHDEGFDHDLEDDFVDEILGEYGNDEIDPYDINDADLGLEDPPDDEKLDRRPDVPQFAREMDLEPSEVDANLELLKTLGSKIENHLIRSDQKERRKEAAKRLYREHRGLLHELEVKYDASPFLIESAPVIEAETGLTTEDFLDTFEGGNPERVLGDGFVSRERGEHYDEGVEELERLAHTEGDYETDINYEEIVRDSLGAGLAENIDLNQVRERAENNDRSLEAVLFDEELGQLIGEKMQEDPEEGQRLVEKKGDLKERIKEEKRRQAFEEVIHDTVEDENVRERAYREIHESDNPDLDFLAQEDVKEMLGTLAEDHLSENSSAYHDAERLSSRMDGNEVRFEIYDKSLENIPYKEDRDLPCTFPGSVHHTSHLFMNYMLDPATQVGKIETEKGDGVALMKMVEHEGEDFLYVHSVEADKGVNIASDKEISRTIQGQIEEYAEELSQQEPEIAHGEETREIDVEGILYSMERHNNGTPGNFQDALKEDDDYSVERVSPEHVGLKHDAFDHDFESGVRAYRKEV